MAISKRVISVIMTIAMLLTVVQIGVSAIDFSSGESVESTQVMVDDGTGKIISPTVTVTATPVVRVASATGALTPGTTIVSATPSGIPYITGNYTKEAYAGETPTNAMITFKSDLSLANNKNVTITCVNNSTVTFTVTNPDNNTWVWTITGGTAQAGTYLDFEIGYSYTYTDKLTQKSITKSYKAYASSYVEGIAQPAGVYFNNYRTKPWNHSGTYGDMVYRILGIGTYGSYYDDGTAGAGDSYSKDASVWAHGYYDFINVDNIASPSDNGPGSVVGWGTNAANAQGYGLVLWGKDNGDGNKYGNTGLDAQRPVSTTYIDSSTGTALNNANINLRYTVFDEVRGYKSGEYFRALTSSAVLPGEVAWTDSYSSDYTATTQLGFGAINEVVILNKNNYPESEFRLTNYALSVPFNGTTYKDAMTTLSDGTKYVAYTFITKLTTDYTTGRGMWNHSAVDLRFYMYNKAEIKSLVNEMLTENPPVSPTGPETGINPQESYYSSGWTAYKTALTNAQRVIAKPNVMQADIDAAKTALDEAKANLVVATADYTAVNLALSTVAGLDPSLYTPDSWARVTAARTAVKENYTVFYQPAVDKMATDLNAAIDALVEADADYTNVDAAIEAANAIDRSVYSDATLKTLDDAVANASTVENRSKKISQQAFVDALAEAIYDAIDALQYKLADYTAVNNAIARYEALDQNLYTTASWSRVQANREAIVMNLNITMQAEVDEMAANLNSAIDKLVKKPADYTAVDAKIDEALLLDESNYTPASWQKLMNAIDSVVYDLTIDQQSTVDGYAAAITSAIASLQYVVGDYTDVIAAVNAAKALNKSYYTTDSWQNLQDKINAVDYTLTIDKQTTIDSYADSINSAISALVLLPADYTRVEALVAQYNALNTNLYTSASLLNVRKAVLAVDYTKTIDKQAEVDAMATAIDNAIKALQYKAADYTAVNTALTNANKIISDAEAYAAAYNNNSYYTATTYKALKDAVAAVVTGLDIRYQTQVTGYATAINNAIAGLINNTADYTAVNVALASIPADLNSGRYTAASVTAVELARDAVVEGLLTSEQSTVDAYASAIADAVSKLGINPADYSSVTAALSMVPSDSSIYTTDSWAAVDAAVKAVVYGLTIDDQATVDGYAAAIISAVNKLVVDQANYSKVNTAKSNAEAALASSEAQYYTQASKDAVTAAINAVVYNLKSSEQARVDGFATAINNAVAALAYMPIDTTGYTAAKATIPSDLSVYTADSVKAVNDAVSAIDTFLAGNVNIKNQAELDALVATLTDAISKLAYKAADYTAVNAAVERANALNADNYVDFSAVTAAIDAVDYTKTIDKQAEVDAMAQAIEDAIDALEPKKADYTALNALVAGDYADALAEKDLYTNFADVESAYNAIDWELNVFQQATVNGYVASLAAAIEALEYKSADYTALNAKINEFKALNAADYTNYGAAYLKVNEVSTWLNSNGSLNIKEQSLVDEQTAKVQAAIDSLIPVATAYFGANADSTCVIDGSYIYGLKTRLTASTLKNTYLDYENVELTIENPNGGRYLGTGSTVTVEYPDGKTEVYTIVIFGDLDGDGNITADDSIVLKSYINGTLQSDFTAAQKKASNLDGSRRIDGDDFLTLSRAVAGSLDLNQVDPSES